MGAHGICRDCQVAARINQRSIEVENDKQLPFSNKPGLLIWGMALSHASAGAGSRSFAWWKVVAAVVLFGISFGYVEAAVVAYLRSIYTPLRAHLYPGSPAPELFPLLSLEQLRRLGPEHTARLKIELAREFATLVMLGGFALAIARNLREWVAAFFTCFGIWDITFYLWLKLLLAWPASILTWDILFLLPVPWVSPVLAPVIVSVSMISAGLLLLWREYHGRPTRFTSLTWSGIVLGAILIFLAFIADFRNTENQGFPHAFHWSLFVAGEVIALMAFLYGLNRSARDLPRANV